MKPYKVVDNKDGTYSVLYSYDRETPDGSMVAVHGETHTRPVNEIDSDIIAQQNRIASFQATLAATQSERAIVQALIDAKIDTSAVQVDINGVATLKP